MQAGASKMWLEPVQSRSLVDPFWVHFPTSLQHPSLTSSCIPFVSTLMSDMLLLDGLLVPLGAPWAPL